MDIQQQTEFLEKLLELDQKPREDFFATDNKEEKNAIGKLMMEQDKKNLADFLSFLENYEWPYKSLHSEKACDAAWLIIQHSSFELMEKYLPVLKARADMNEANKMHVAMMEDRLLMSKGQKQIYGSQARYIENKGLYMWPVENAEIVNQLRLAANFPMTFEEKTVDLNASYDPAIKISDFQPIL